MFVLDEEKYLVVARNIIYVSVLAVIWKHKGYWAIFISIIKSTQNCSYCFYSSCCLRKRHIGTLQCLCPLAQLNVVSYGIGKDIIFHALQLESQ